ncbi:MAG: BamA/TamA family outer membrane protein [Saprospiraceae bacterium]|nr:BamA/TamA family outer membrane protein [Saprospiraceae bacterium]
MNLIFVSPFQITTVHITGILIKIYICILVLYSPSISSQNDFVIIDSVLIHGLHKTKKIVINQEIDLHPGDTISLDQLAKKLSSNEKRLQSIGLFTLAIVNLKDWNIDLKTCNIDITVQENWFIYPYIIFELADRNFNVWRKEFNYSFKRVNYGAAFNHINFTGQKDKLKVKLQGGYVRKLELLYDFPYLWRNWGLSTNLLYSESRETAFRSINNKPVFYSNKDDRKVFYQHRANITLLHRSNPQHFQSLRLEYSNISIDKIIAETLNPNYFGDKKHKINYFILDFYAKYDNTLYPLYPMAGFKLEFNMRKEGLGIFDDVNNTWVTGKAEIHSPLFKKVIISNNISFKINLQKNALPYILNNALGYNSNNITGYQLYVMDGRHFILFKNAIRLSIFDHTFKPIKYLPKQFKVMNAKIFFRLNLDGGYSYDPLYKSDNPLSNTWQYGFGPGLDMILFNNFTLSAEYGITKFGEKGLFFESGFNF